MDTNAWTVVIAAYAAIVATGALFLEVRRWFETGPRIKLNVMSEAIVIGGGESDENTYLAITVTNAGTSSTTVTHMLLKEYNNWWAKLRRRSSFSGLVPRAAPVGGRELPAKLDVGDIWHGQATYNEDLARKALGGKLWVGVACSHSRKDVMRRVTLSTESKLPIKFKLTVGSQWPLSASSVT